MRATQQRKRFVSRELVALAANQPQAFADYSEVSTVPRSSPSPTRCCPAGGIS